MNSRLPRFAALLILLTATAVAATWQRREVADARTIATTTSTTAAGEAVAGVMVASYRGEPTVGGRLLVQAISQLERRGSVAARLRHQVAIAGERFYGAGSYWQQGTGEDLRVRLEIQVAGHDAALLQVSNSRFLWTDQRLPTGRVVTRLDYRQLRAAISVAEQGSEANPAGASWSSVQPDLTAYSGGLLSLLSMLEKNYSFLPPQAMRLSLAPPATQQPASIPVFALVGHWKPDRLAALWAKNGHTQPGGSTELETLFASLPSHIPHEVLLLVGQADLFPYRIEYRRLETPAPVNGETSSVPYRLSANPMVVLELSDVAFDVPIAAGQFDYFPADVHWSDQTAVILERLRRQRHGDVAVAPAP